MALQVLRLVALLSCVALLPGSILLMWLGKSSNTRGFLHSETREEMRFQKPRLLRAGVAALGLWFPCALALLFLLQSVPSRPVVTTQNAGNLFLIGAVFGLLAWLLVSVSGPNDLSLDSTRRTYRWRQGVPWRSRLRTGTWEEIAGIYVRRRRTGREDYIVSLRWKGTWRSFLLGQFHNRASAERFAEAVTNKLHLPRVEPPPPPQLRDVFKS